MRNKRVFLYSVISRHIKRQQEPTGTVRKKKINANNTNVFQMSLNWFISTTIKVFMYIHISNYEVKYNFTGTSCTLLFRGSDS